MFRQISLTATMKLRMGKIELRVSREIGEIKCRTRIVESRVARVQTVSATSLMVMLVGVIAQVAVRGIRLTVNEACATLPRDAGM